MKTIVELLYSPPVSPEQLAANSRRPLAQCQIVLIIAAIFLLFQICGNQPIMAQSVVGRGNDPKYGSSYAAMNHMVFGLDLLAEGTPDALHYARQHFVFIIDMKEDQGLKPEAYLNLGVVETLEGNPSAAVKDFLAAIQLKPNYPEAYFNLGGAYYKLGANKNAEEAFLKAIELQPGYGRAHYSLGFVYLDQKKYDLAKVQAEKAAENGVLFKTLKERLSKVGR
jgi:tetratricopeptide (TPR) repeat protein